MNKPDATVFVVVESSYGEQVHAFLKQNAWLDRTVAPIEAAERSVGFPVSDLVGEQEVAEAVAATLGIDAEIVRQPTVRRSPVNPHERLKSAVSSWFASHLPQCNPEPFVPKKWERLGELALLPHALKETEVWEEVSPHEHASLLWKAMAAALGVSSLGLQAPIADDLYRSAQVCMLLGSPLVKFIDHGITYTFDASKVMFSSGNITERRRIAGMDMAEEVVIDAYAGVGYYTFPMLVHAGAKHVHACEINPASITGLEAGAEANGISHRLTVHPGDNVETLARLKGQADRCHLGLLPSSELAWEGCLMALKPSGGVLHIHMNVEEEKIERWVKATVHRFEKLVAKHGLGFSIEAQHVERVKWFAPRVRHVVLDLSLRP